MVGLDHQGLNFDRLVQQCQIHIDNQWQDPRFSIKGLKVLVRFTQRQDLRLQIDILRIKLFFSLSEEIMRNAWRKIWSSHSFFLSFLLFLLLPVVWVWRDKSFGEADSHWRVRVFCLRFRQLLPCRFDSLRVVCFRQKTQAKAESSNGLWSTFVTGKAFDVSDQTISWKTQSSLVAFLLVRVWREKWNSTWIFYFLSAYIRQSNTKSEHWTSANTFNHAQFETQEQTGPLFFFPLWRFLNCVRLFRIVKTITWTSSAWNCPGKIHVRIRQVSLSRCSTLCDTSCFHIFSCVYPDLNTHKF